MLRTALGVVVIARSVLLLSAPESTMTSGVLAGLSGMLTGALLVAGFFTVLAAVLLGVLSVYALWSGAVTVPIIDSGTTAVLGCIVGFALVLLGPGAFSADARLFGPREIIIPPGTESGRRASK